MSRNISLYPILNKNLISRIGYERQLLQFSFNINDKIEKISLPDNLTENLIVLDDRNHQWSINKDNLIVDLTVSVANLKVLFEEDGIISKDSTLGLAVEWFSRESRIKKSHQLKLFKYSDIQEIDFHNLVFEIPQDVLRKDVEVSYFFYLHDLGHLKETQSNYKANVVGSRLGELDNFKLILEGQGSEFPILLRHDTSNVLWYVESLWNDPFVESFNDTVSLIINSSHRSYKYIKPDDKSYNVDFMDEVMRSALLVIIDKVVNDTLWIDHDQSDRVLEGSVAGAVAYFIQTFNLNIESTEQLSKSINNIKF